MDGKRLSAVGRRMRAAGQEAYPIPGSHSPKCDGLSPFWHSMPSGRASCSSSWTSPWGSPLSPSPAGREIPAPHPPGLGITVYYVIEGKVEFRLPTPDGGTRPGWWLRAMAYVYPWSAPSPPRAVPPVPPDTRALVLVCQCPVHVPRGTPAAAPPPPRCRSASNGETGMRRWTRPGWTSRTTGPLSPRPGGRPWSLPRPW